jgi:hypothetical protein
LNNLKVLLDLTKAVVGYLLRNTLNGFHQTDTFCRARPCQQKTVDPFARKPAFARKPVDPFATKPIDLFARKPVDAFVS